LAADGSSIYSASGDSTVLAWDLKVCDGLLRWSNHGCDVVGVCWWVTDQRLYQKSRRQCCLGRTTGCEVERDVGCAAQTGDVVRELPGDKHGASALCIHEASNVLAVGWSVCRTPHLFATRWSAVPLVLPLLISPCPHPQRVTPPSYTIKPQLATTTDPHTHTHTRPHRTRLLLVDATSGSKIRKFSAGHSASISALAFSDDGRFLATASEGSRHVSIFDGQGD
jgi:WD40 repeat protein